MSENITLPKDLISYLSTQKKDFVIKSGRTEPATKIIANIFIGVCCIIPAVFVTPGYLIPLLQGKDIYLTYNGESVIANLNNFSPLVMYSIAIGFLFLFGLLSLFWGIYLVFKKGGYFVGTASGLINYRDGKIRSINWEEFSGEIKVTGNDRKGNIMLIMQKGLAVPSRGGGNHFIPANVYISEIPNISEIEKICRKRINENSASE